MSYKVKKISLDYLEENANLFFDLWSVIWNDSAWQDLDFMDKENRTKYLRKFITNGIGLMLTYNNKMIGLLFGNINNHQEPENEYERELYESIFPDEIKFSTLDELAIMKEHRNNGNGKMFVNKYFENMNEENIDKIFLYTEKTSKSHGFYKKIGFERIGKINRIPRTDLPLGYEDRIYYVKNL